MNAGSKRRSRRACQSVTTSENRFRGSFRAESTPDSWPSQYGGDDAALELIDRPPQTRSERETGRVLRILDEIAVERPPLAVEMLVSRDARRDRNSNGRAKQ